MTQKGPYYSGSDLLSHDAPISICQSIRNLGKSYWFMRLCLKVVTNGGACAWSRWDRTELGTAMTEFQSWTDAEDWTLERVTDQTGFLYRHCETGGRFYFLAVKDAVKYKGLDDPEIRYWVYDEFIPEFYQNRTRKRDEFDFWGSLHTTLKRKNERFRAVLLANYISWFNGFYRAWGIAPAPPGPIRRYEQKAVISGKTYAAVVAFEAVKPTEEMIERVVLAEVMKGKSADEIERYLSGATKDGESFVEKPPPSEVPLSRLQWRHKGRFISFREINGLVYFVTHAERRGIPVLALDRFELEPGIVRDRSAGKAFEDWINAGIARFDTAEAQSLVFDMVAAARERIQ